jgi:hypothetical protein
MSIAPVTGPTFGVYYRHDPHPIQFVKKHHRVRKLPGHSSPGRWTATEKTLRLAARFKD